jgi:hypothetical protein
MMRIYLAGFGLFVHSFLPLEVTSLFLPEDFHLNSEYLHFGTRSGEFSDGFIPVGRTSPALLLHWLIQFPCFFLRLFVQVE